MKSHPCLSKAYAEPSQTSKMELFAKSVSGLIRLRIERP